MTASAFSGPGRQSVYTGRITNWPVVILSAVLAVPLLALGQTGGGDWRDVTVPALVVGAAVLLGAVTSFSVRTAAGPNGVVVRLGALGWPRCGYRIEQIERAEVFDLPLSHVVFGFWWTPRRTCCTVRSGPTLRLILVNGRTVTVSVPDPYAAVAAVDEARSS
jgi:hypothetical protein